MTTFQTQQHTPHIGFPASEDPMEVTTDMDRHFEAGEDIDIDLDLTGDAQRDEEDEYMGEDDEEIIDTGPVGEPDSNTTNDDEMADGGYLEGSLAGRSSVHDEDLEDANYEPGIDEDVIVDVVVENPSDTFLDLLDNEEHVDASGLYGNDHDKQAFNVTNHGDQDYHEQLGTYESDVDASGETLLNGQKEAPNISHGESGLSNQEPSLKDHEQYCNRQQGTLAISHDEAEPAIRDSLQEDHDETRHHGTEGTVGTLPQELEHSTSSRTGEAVIAAPTQEKSTPSSNIGDETHLHNRPIASDGAFAVDSIHIHPVMVVYQDNVISLFPPVNREQDGEDEEERSLTFFLDDEQLASDSIQNLLGALRSVLGESVNEQDELTIEIEELGIHISESSTDCSTRSLSEVIDIYVRLQHYDGLDSPPALYMNLTTKARFSHRLETLLFAIAEKRGLSQTRSSYAVEERQQLEAEGVPGPHAGDEFHPADVSPDQEDKTSVASQDANTGDSHGVETAENDHVASSSLSDKSKPVSPPLKVNASAGNTKRGDDQVCADTITHESDSAVADDQHSEVPRTDSPRSSPQLAPPTESERPGLEESIVDDDDFIDYEDDGEPAQGTSCGSSTLQGDMFDGTANGNVTDSEKWISQEEPAELQDSGNLRKHTAKGRKMTHDALHDKISDPITKTGEHEHSGLVDQRPEYLEFFGEEDNAASPDERSKMKESSKNIEQSSQPQNHDIPPGKNINGNQEEGFKQSQNVSAPLQTAVSPEQQDMVNDGEDGLEGTQLDTEREHEDQSNTNQSDYEDSGAVLPNDDYHRETDDGYEDTKLVKPNFALPVGNGETVDGFSPIGKTELQLSSDGRGHSQDDDDDEITYEDEENEEQTRTHSLPAERKSVPSPGSLKRARSLHEDDVAIEDDLQDTKRIRSF